MTQPTTANDRRDEWQLSWRADPFVAAFADRHYSRKTVGAVQFAPPGRFLALKTPTAVWVSLWPDPQYVDHDWPEAWCNTLFRNEGPRLSSELIREAVACTRWKWPTIPPLGMVTFIDAAKVRHKRDPGRCYLKAGFKHVVGFTKAGQHVLQLLPDAMPDAAEPIHAQGTFALGAAS